MGTENSLRYMIIGTGGTGGAIGAHLAHAGKDVTFIARGMQLETMRTSGLRLHRPDEEFTVYPVKAYSMEEYPSEQNRRGAFDNIERDALSKFSFVSPQGAVGRKSEVDGLIYEVVRLGEKYRVKVPLYTMIAEELRKRGIK